MPTEFGSAVHRGRRPSEDAACVALAAARGRDGAGQDGDDGARVVHARARRATRTGSVTRRVGRRAGRRRPSRRAWCPSRSGRRPRARSCGRRRSAASRATRRPTASCRCAACSRWRPGSTRWASSRARSPTWRSCAAALLGVAIARPAAPAAPRLVLWEAPELEPPMRSALAGAAAALVDAGAAARAAGPRGDRRGADRVARARHALRGRADARVGGRPPGAAERAPRGRDRRGPGPRRGGGPRRARAGRGAAGGAGRAARRRGRRARRRRSGRRARRAWAPPAHPRSRGRGTCWGCRWWRCPRAWTTRGCRWGSSSWGGGWCDDALLALGLWAEAVLPPAVRPW